MPRTRIHHFEGFSIKKAGIDIKLDMSRVEGNFNKAQYVLDSAVMQSMVPFMPHRDGSFIQRTTAESAAKAGTGEVVAAAGPFGRYLYMGKVMVDSVTGKGPAKIPTGPGEFVLRFRYGSKLKPTNRPLQYSKAYNPKARSHWFDAAKKRDSESWVRVVKKNAGGG